jgi:hypothetical protein
VKLKSTTLLATSFFLLPALVAAGPIDYGSQVKPVLQAHCFKCHGEQEQKGDLRLDTLSSNFAQDRRAAERWHDVRDAINLGEMPPEDEPDLSSQDRRLLTTWIDDQIEALAASEKSTAGQVVLRRLNRVEYQNTMRDLLGIETDYAKNLPPEGLSEDGFRNNGLTLQMSALQLEYYLQAARDGLSKAIVTGGQPEVFRHQFSNSIKDKNRGSNRLDDDEQFVAKLMEYPSAGEILIRVKARAKLVEGRGYPQLRAAIGYRADVQAPRRFIPPVDVTSEEWETFEFRDRIEHFPLPSKTQSKFPGLLVWLDNAYAEGANKPLKPRRKAKQKKGKNAPEVAEQPSPPTYPLIEIESIEFVGPVFESWPPQHHTQILFPDRRAESEQASYVTAVLQRFMTRAFRRPVTDQEIIPYQQFFAQVRRTSSSFEAAMRETLAMVLISPDFLYLFEPGKEKRPLDDWELASRLSYFLWSTMPDQRLRQLAGEGKLRQQEVLRGEVARMIADPRSWQFVEQFAQQWLDLGGIDRVAINPEFYPDFDNALKPSLRGETLNFFATVLYEKLSALNFLDSDFTMLNEPLAKHYGLSGPRGSQFERVDVTAGQRGGVLTHAGVLLGNSTGDDSHPVKRAVWLRERLLNDPPADPPPNVPNLDSTDPNFAALPVREQLRLHRQDAACNDCHRGIDPWGIALENFGADGLWRNEILRKKAKGKGLEGRPVEAATVLPDGSKIAGLGELKTYLLTQRRGQFAKAFTTKLLTYALGRTLELTDQPAIDELTAKFVEADYRMDQLIQLIVAAESFQTK